MTDDEKKLIEAAVKWAWTDMAFKPPELQPNDPVAFISGVVVRYLEANETIELAQPMTQAERIARGHITFAPDEVNEQGATWVAGHSFTPRKPGSSMCVCGETIAAHRPPSALDEVNEAET